MSGKRYNASAQERVKGEVYSIADAIAALKKFKTAKFDETVDVATNLGVDPKHADQMVRGVVGLPNGLGKEVRVAVFAKGDKVEEAKKAGADVVADEESIVEVLKDINFDRCIATPDMMASLGKHGRVLGPKGLMPNPKLGTVTNDLAEAIKSAKSGQVEFKVEKNGVVHAGVGKISFDEKALQENIKAFMTAIEQAKPSGAKGTYIKTLSLSTTMGPSVSVDVQSVVSG